MTSPHGEVHLSLPPERFFWTLLDAATLPGPNRRDSKALGFLFENVLPLPIEQVCVAYAPAQRSAHIVACGMPRERLKALTQEHSAALTLTPQALPKFLENDVSAAVVDVRRLNLLIGDVEPQALGRAKRRLAAQAAALILLICAVVIAGLERRTSVLHGQIAASAAQRHEMIAATIGPASSLAQPPELRMLAELRSLLQTRGQNTGGTAATTIIGADVLASFASLLGSWPRDLHIRTESVLISPTSMTLRGRAPSSGDVQTLANALSNLDGWRLEQPQISVAAGTSGEQVQATLQWTHEAGSGTTSSPDDAKR